MNTQPLLAATDFSSGATRAVERAASLAARLGAALHLLHVSEECAWQRSEALHGMLCAADSDPLRHARQHLEALCAMVRQKFGAQATCAVLAGRASDEIVGYVARHDVQLIVLGSRGEHILKDWTLGGTALDVLDRAGRAVLVVRRSSDEPYATALVATDFSSAAQRAEAYARKLVSSQDVHLAHAVRLPFEGRLRLAGVPERELEIYQEHERSRALEALRSAVGPQTPARALHAVRGHPSVELLELASRLQVKLIVTGRHSGQSIATQLLGSVTRNILHRAETDVLVVP